MASLHSALHYLAPCDFSDIPSSPNELDKYLTELFSQTQLILESIPISAVDDSKPSSTVQSPNKSRKPHASSSAEIIASSSRSPPPPPEYAALQKEWGKPVKLSAKENPLGISVYKVGGKDGKGAWFARRSVHEGLGFARFKRGFEKEFPTSLAVQGSPGEGNIRGIGADERVEDVSVPNKGKIEVYRLSAQFPGPTTPRDFVTLLATSSKAFKEEHAVSKIPEITPRHYMIVSKPCNHPQTQPRDGFIRGQYESVEFIREIPRKLRSSTSSTNLKQLAHKHDQESLEKDVLKRNAEKQDHNNFVKRHTDPHEDQALSDDDNKSSSVRRKRSVTVGAGERSSRSHDRLDDYDPEQNPVEWIMVTRSDPGGSVPRFMVERGTPSSICADAQKFLDWACQQDETAGQTEISDRPSSPERKKSFASWEANGHLAGVFEQKTADDDSPTQQPTSPVEKEIVSKDDTESPNVPPAQTSTGYLSSMAGTLGTYAPQTVLDRLGLHPTEEGQNNNIKSTGEDHDISNLEPRPMEDDAVSTISSTSFASADSHLGSEDEPSISSKSSPEKVDTHQMGPHEKELAKLTQRRAALEAKMASTREKYTTDNEKENSKEQLALKKAEEKHERELKKNEEKYQKEVLKLEQKKQKEAKKLEEKKRKQNDKDEKAKLVRERDEARAELDIYKKEREIWEEQVGKLQRENTALAARIGRLEGSATPTSSVLDDDKSRHGRLRGLTTSTFEGRNRSSSTISRKKE